MKAIVANLLSGSILCCSLLPHPVLADPQFKKPSKLPISQILPAKFLAYDKLPIFSGIVNNLDLVFKSQDIRQNQLVFLPNSNRQTTVVHRETLSLNKKPYVHKNSTGGVTLGFQKTFWPSHNSGKYWGLTTVEYWGDKNQPEQNLSTSAGIDTASILAPGNGKLTVSGGGNTNLVTKTDLLGEFDEFRGGVAFHQGLSSDVTMGVGFVYEDLLIGFSQFIFKSDRLPLQTTVSLLTGASGLEIHSQLQFKPAKDFVLNYYNQQQQQKFDLNWELIPGLNLLAQGNSQHKSLSTGIKINLHSHYFSLSAKAVLGNNHRWQWQLNSRLGALYLVHGSNHLKSNSELSYDFWQPESLGWKFSLAVKYQTRNLETSQENLTVWTGRWHSGSKVNNDHRWRFDIGYGYGSQGSGAIASVTTTLKPNLKLKLTYQEISVVSERQNLKLELSSH